MGDVAMERILTGRAGALDAFAADIVAVMDFPSGTAMQKAMTTVLSEGLFTVEISEAMPLDDFVSMLKEDEGGR